MIASELHEVCRRGISCVSYGCVAGEVGNRTVVADWFGRDGDTAGTVVTTRSKYLTARTAEPYCSLAAEVVALTWPEQIACSLVSMRSSSRVPTAHTTLKD